MLMLLVIGLTTVLSSAIKSGMGEVSPYFARQLMWAFLGLLAMVAAVLVDYRVIAMYAYHFYAAILVFLLIVLVMGREVHGAQRWLRLVGLQVQPSEIVKLVTLFALAHYLDDVRERIREFGFLLAAVVIVAIPTALIVLQPDLGTGLVLVALLGGMLLAANARRRHLAAFAICGIAAAPLLWGFLKDYQKTRLLSFVNPNLDPLGASYQVIQSKIAIGAGGFVGTGWLQGTQSRLNFLPEQHTDFIFSVFAEQWGFMGCCLLVMLYMGLLLQALKIAESARDFLGSMLAVGVVVIISFQVLVNLPMTVGFMPVTGIPLPFMSYGGSNLLTMMACVGLLLSIGKRSHIF
ncbi:MAG: rod shape-determining protein RodA [Candidatus Abyssubacteria bacterium]|nr:rod shape-determining protein RodA [Candidatus Abyssubacteria bacterium]